MTAIAGGRTACGVKRVADPVEDGDDGCGWGDYCPNSPRFAGDPFTTEHPQWAPLPGQCNACFLYQHEFCERRASCTCPHCHPNRTHKETS